MSIGIIEFIAWTCAIIFALTGVITLLSITNVIKIKEEFQKKLFYTLLLEIVIGSVWGYNKYLKDFSSSSEWNFIAITTPEINITNDDIDTITIDLNPKYGTQFFNGVVQFDRSKNIIPKFEYIENDQVVYGTQLTINPSGIFNLKIPVGKFSDSTNCKIRAYLEDDGEVIKEYLINGYIRKYDSRDNNN